MKKTSIVLLVLITVNLSLFANIKYINYKSFPEYDQNWRDIAYVYTHQYYMEIYTPEWNYDVDKTELINKMESVFTLFSELQLKDPENIDLNLFIGEIAHFLFNLDVPGYFDLAIQYYEKAKEIEPKDIRSDWFLGFHLSQAAQPIKGMEKLLHVSTAMPPLKMPPFFWVEYATSAYYAQMYWNSLQAIEYFKELSDEVIPFIENLYDDIHSDMVVPDVYQEYEISDLWTSIFGAEVPSYKSYLLGMNIENPKNWNLQFNRFKYAKSNFILKPERYNGYENKKVGSTIVSLINVNYDDSNLSEYMDSLLKDHQIITEKKIDLPYEDVIAYSIKDPTLYTEQGGGELFMIGIRRPSPETPGISIEKPAIFPEVTDGVKYFNIDKIYKRFDQDIFYVFVLDACKSIFDEAYPDYLNFIKENVIIE